MSASTLLCFPRELARPEDIERFCFAADTCSVRIPRTSVRQGRLDRLLELPHRRHFLKLLGGSLLLPALFSDDLLAGEFVSKGVDPARLWDGERQLVFAYKQGETMGEPCQRLDAAKEELPISIIWRLPPDWVKQFPTIHFEVSSRRWKQYPGWKDASDFVTYYEKYLPPPKFLDQASPFKPYASAYDGPEWTYPGKITDHLLDPKSPHRFSEYELCGLSKQEQENLHSAHHEESIAPGLRPPVKGQRLTQSG